MISQSARRGATPLNVINTNEDAARSHCYPIKASRVGWGVILNVKTMRSHFHPHDNVLYRTDVIKVDKYFQYSLFKDSPDSLDRCGGKWLGYRTNYCTTERQAGRQAGWVNKVY